MRLMCSFDYSLGSFTDIPSSDKPLRALLDAQQSGSLQRTYEVLSTRDSFVKTLGYAVNCNLHFKTRFRHSVKMLFSCQHIRALCLVSVIKGLQTD